MTLLSFRSFSDRTPAGAQMPPDYSSTASTNNYSAGRFAGSYCIHGNGRLIYGPAGGILSGATVICGYARFDHDPGGASNDNEAMVFYDSSSAAQFTVDRNVSTGVVTAKRGSTVVATATLSLPFGQWNYLECKFSLADSGGICVVRINGTEVINFTGDTRNSGSNPLASIRIGMQNAGSSPGTGVADFYVCDTAGSAPFNDFLGDVHVERLTPSGNGTYSQMVGSDGNSTDNYLLVDETPTSGSDYVASATVGQRDTYAMSDLVAATGTVHAVKVNVTGYKTDAGAASVKTVVRSGSNETLSSAQALGTSSGVYGSGVLTTKPGGGSWSISDVNALEAGAEVA